MFLHFPYIKTLEVVTTDLTEEQKAILVALNSLTEPAGCKVIGEAADMPWRSVMAKLRGLRKEDLVESPEKGKYVISDKGKAAIV
jgi:predicted transcriptional regulator